jgi:4-diphosphocytidyl-2C-methyl-D-erythritol kinase
MSGSGSVLYGVFDKKENGANTFHQNMKKAFAPTNVFFIPEL